MSKYTLVFLKSHDKHFFIIVRCRDGWTERWEDTHTDNLRRFNYSPLHTLTYTPSTMSMNNRELQHDLALITCNSVMRTQFLESDLQGADANPALLPALLCYPRGGYYLAQFAFQFISHSPL